MATRGSGTKDDPWQLKTPPGTSDYSAIDDLHAWLREQGDWVPFGAADEQKAAAEESVEAWGRSESNPKGGWYGVRKGYRGPLLEALGLAEVEHNPRNNRMRAI